MHQLSARHLRPPGSLRMSPVDPFQHVAQLRGGNCNDTVRRRWPDEPTVLQSLGVERHPQTVMPKNFQQVTAFSPENVEVTGMWIAEQRLLNLQRETVHATAHVSRTSRQPDANTRRRDNHRRSAVITRRSVARPTSCPTLTEVPSGSVISILPPDTAGSGPLADDGSICFVPLPFADPLIVCTGRNTGGGSGLSTPRRTWLRQFHSRPRLTSYRRATSAMPEPGCSVSATIRSFSSRRQRRRRSTPVMISILLAASDLSGAHTSAV